MKKFFSDFKAFITKGNILDMAIGVIIGGAFNTIVTTLNKQVLMPIVNWALSYISGGSELVTVLPNNTLYDPSIHEGVEPIVLNGVKYLPNANYINWSAFIESIINFFFIAMTLFIILKVVKYLGKKRLQLEEALKKKIEKPEAEEVQPEPTPEPEPEPVVDPVVVLLQEIRDTLKQNEKAE